MMLKNKPAYQSGIRQFSGAFGWLAYFGAF
jgi:hypothetical protein